MNKNLTTSSSREIIRAAQSGDQSAVNRFSARYWGLVASWARNYPLQNFEPEDVAQDVLIRVLLNLKTYDPTLGRFRSWLGTITRNCALDLLEDQNASGGNLSFGNLDELGKLVSDGFDQDEESIGTEELKETSSLVYDALKEHFDEDHWFCFVGMTVLGMSATEIGKELGLKPAAVRKRKQRIIEKLPRLLEEGEEAEEVEEARR
ncbi:MAG: RNA polymerase sigma factor [Mariniblastus sp.]